MTEIEIKQTNLNHTEYLVQLRLRDIKFDLFMICIISVASSVFKWVAILGGAINLKNPAFAVYLVFMIVLSFSVVNLINDFKIYLAYKDTYLIEMVKFKYDKKEAEQRSTSNAVRDDYEAHTEGGFNDCTKHSASRYVKYNYSTVGDGGGTGYTLCSGNSCCMQRITPVAAAARQESNNIDGCSFINQ